jgi:hypothetical protein
MLPENCSAFGQCDRPEHSLGFEHDEALPGSAAAVPNGSITDEVTTDLAVGSDLATNRRLIAPILCEEMRVIADNRFDPPEFKE